MKGDVTLHIRTEDRLRLTFNYHGLISAYGRLELAVEKKDDMGIYVSSSELILWAMNIEKWLFDCDEAYRNDKSAKVLKSGVGELKGLKFIFNTLKHDMGFIQTHRKNTDLTIPFDSNFQQEKPNVYWKKILTASPTPKKNINQRKNYEKYLAEKDLLLTVKDAISYISSRRRENIIP